MPNPNDRDQFPSALIGGTLVEFFPAPAGCPDPRFALVFVWSGDQVLLADIPGRGWCIPSGRIEPGESAEQAARREALEETGAELNNLEYLGCNRLVAGDGYVWATNFVADIAVLLPMPDGSESRGRLLSQLEELPGLYYAWNPLTEAVFEYSWQAIQRIRSRY